MIEIVVPSIRLHREQEKVLRSKARYKVVAAGRRFGKTLLALEWLALHPGGALDGYPVGLFAPRYKIMLDAWNALRKTLAPVSVSQSRVDWRITLVTGGTIDFWTLEDEDAGRSRKYKRVVIDEAAHVPNLQDIWEMAIKPTLADLQGEAWFISTPRGTNYFYELFMLGQKLNDWKSFQVPTWENPHIPRREIEEARRLLPDSVFRQEYGAEFIAQGGGIDVRAIQEALRLPGPQGPLPGRRYVAGLDLARTGDYTALAILDITDPNVSQLVSLDRFQDSWEVTVRRVTARLREYGARLVVDATGVGDPIYERLTQEWPQTYPFRFTAQSKTALLTELRMAFLENAISIYPHTQLVQELTSLEVKQTAYGISYSHPPGGHDDTVIALALALWAAKAPAWGVTGKRV